MKDHENDPLRKEEVSKRIGDTIKSLRNALSISQSELGKRCGKDKQHIELIENGKVSPNIYSLYLISLGLETDLHEIFKTNLLKS